jgi:hypothetical protein
VELGQEQEQVLVLVQVLLVQEPESALLLVSVLASALALVPAV